MAFGRYLIKRGVFLLITLVLAVYVSVVIANFGGLIDDILKAQIGFGLRQALRADPDFNALPEEVQEEIFLVQFNAQVEARGLNEPFIPKSIGYTIDALQLNLGTALVLTDAAGSKQISDIILERLPRTLILFFTADIIAAGFGIWLGMNPVEVRLLQVQEFAGVDDAGVGDGAVEPAVGRNRLRQLSLLFKGIAQVAICISEAGL